MKNRIATILILGLLMLGQCFAADIPRVLNYQGRVVSGGVVFQGTGQFKFALVNADGTAFYWRNDGATGIGEPATTVALNVTKGLFSVRLGDTAFPNMAAIPEAVFQNTDLKLRVWFNDGVKGSQQLAPDAQMAAAAFAMSANGSAVRTKTVVATTFPIFDGHNNGGQNGTLIFITKAPTIPIAVTDSSGRGTDVRLPIDRTVRRITSLRGVLSKTHSGCVANVKVIRISSTGQIETVASADLVSVGSQLETEANTDITPDFDNYGYFLQVYLSTPNGPSGTSIVHSASMRIEE